MRTLFKLLVATTLAACGPSSPDATSYPLDTGTYDTGTYDTGTAPTDPLAIPAHVIQSVETRLDGGVYEYTVNLTNDHGYLCAGEARGGVETTGGISWSATSAYSCQIQVKQGSWVLDDIEIRLIQDFPEFVRTDDEWAYTLTIRPNNTNTVDWWISFGAPLFPPAQ